MNRFKTILTVLLGLLILATILFLLYWSAKLLKVLAIMGLFFIMINLNLRIGLMVFVTSSLLLVLFRSKSTSKLNRYLRLLFSFFLGYLIIAVAFLIVSKHSEAALYGICDGSEGGTHVFFNRNKSFFISSSNDRMGPVDCYWGWYSMKDSTVNFYCAYPYPYKMVASFKKKDIINVHSWCASGLPKHTNQPMYEVDFGDNNIGSVVMAADWSNS